MLGILGMKDSTPAEIGALFLGHADQLEKGGTGIGVPAFHIANPDAVVDGLADGPVALFTFAERNLGAFALGDIDRHIGDANHPALCVAQGFDHKIIIESLFPD